MTLNETIQATVAGFAKIERIDPSGAAYSRLCAILDQADDEALKAVHAANINFASKLAFNRMIRRGLTTTQTEG
jgi:hypothetical protein